MFYQIRSKGVLIGHADLGYGEMWPRSRIGHFFPNSAGLPLMDCFAAITRAHRRDRHVPVEPPVGDEIPRPAPGWESRYADIAEAHHRAESLELTLHRMDDTIIPTNYITLRDLHEVFVFNAACFEEDDREPWGSSVDGDWRDSDSEALDDEIGGEHLPRYHISVELERSNSIP